MGKDQRQDSVVKFVVGFDASDKFGQLVFEDSDSYRAIDLVGMFVVF